MKDKQAKDSVMVIDACQTTHNYNYCLLNALSQKRVHVIYATTKYPYEEVPPPEGIKVWFHFFYMARAVGLLTSSRLIRCLLRGSEYPFNMLALVTYILFRRIKVVHIMECTFPALDIWIIRLMQFMGCRIVYTAHNPFPHEKKSSSVRNYVRIYHQVDRIIALTGFTRDQIVSEAGIPSGKISVIPHGDFDYVFSKYDTNESLAEKVRLKAAGRPVVSFLGIIRPYKGLKYFLEAFKLIKKQSPQFFFLVAGSLLIGDRDELEELLNTSCEPEDLWKDIRYLPTPDLKAYLSVTDVLVQPYVGASQSGNTVMAFAAGVPIISTNAGGLAEMVEDGKTGYVVSPKDPQAIADAVVKCFQGDNLVKMSKAARSIAVEKYGWEDIAEQTIEIYNQLHEMVREAAAGKG